MKLCLIQFIFVTGFFAASCRELPMVTDNPLDLASENYGPMAPYVWGSQFDTCTNLINWRNKSPHAEGIKIERLLDSLQGFVLIAEISTRFTGYFDHNSLLVRGTFVKYRARAYLGSKVGLASDEVIIYMQ